MRIGQLSLDFDAEADEEDDDAAGGEASADWVDPPLDPARVRAAVAAAEAAFNNALAIEAADDYEDAIAYFALGSARAKLVTLPESAGGSGGGGARRNGWCTVRRQSRILKWQFSSPRKRGSFR